MRTTLRLDDHLLATAKRFAADQGKSLAALVEEGLCCVLVERGRNRRNRTRLPISGRGGLLPGVDLDHSAPLLDLMERQDSHP